jgi:hypothetical protein
MYPAELSEIPMAVSESRTLMIAAIFRFCASSIPHGRRYRGLGLSMALPTFFRIWELILLPEARLMGANCTRFRYTILDCDNDKLGTEAVVISKNNGMNELFGFYTLSRNTM